MDDRASDLLAEFGEWYGEHDMTVEDAIAALRAALRDPRKTAIDYLTGYQLDVENERRQEDAFAAWYENAR